MLPLSSPPDILDLHLSVDFSHTNTTALHTKDFGLAYRASNNCLRACSICHHHDFLLPGWAPLARLKGPCQNTWLYSTPRIASKEGPPISNVRSR